MAGLASTPGLHFALGIASALSATSNLGLLLHWLRKARVVARSGAGLGRNVPAELGVANAAMAAVLLVVRPVAGARVHRHGRGMRDLVAGRLVAGGGLAYALAMLALGFRPAISREH